MPIIAVAWPEFLEFQSRQTSFDGIAGWSYFASYIGANGRAETGFAECVSGDYFRTLGIQASAGRLLQHDDDRPDAPPAAVISDAAWHRWFEASPDAIGKTLTLNGGTYTIAGVAGPEFSGLFNGGLIATSAWITFGGARVLPKAGLAIDFDTTERGHHWIMMTARLKPGRTAAAAAAEVVAIGRAIDAEDPPSPNSFSAAAGARGWSTRRVADAPKIMGAGPIVKPFAAALMMAVALVLLIACTNLANLMLARSATRRYDAAVRLALGASRRRLLRESLAESALLAIAGGAGGLLLAQWLVVFLSTPLVVTRGVAVQIHPSLDVAVLAMSIAATVLALVTAGLGPAWHASGADVKPLMAPADASTASTRWRGRRVLIAVQVTVSVLLVAIAGLCLSQIQQQTARDVGFDPSHLALAEVNFRQQRIDDGRARAIVDDVLSRLGHESHVVAAGVSSGLASGILNPGGSVRGSEGASGVAYLSVTPDAFLALGVATLRGRPFDVRDVAASTPVVVLGDQTAIATLGSVDVIGRDVTVTRSPWANEPTPVPETRTVVGVVREPPIGQRRQGVAYLPFAQRFEGDLVFEARTTGDADALVTTLQRAIHAAAPDVAVSQALTGSALVAQDALFYEVVAAIASVLGAMAVIVALAGLYGILAFLVAGRTREIGIRMAMGADAWDIRVRVLREGLLPVALGLILGLGGGALARMALRPLFLRIVPAFDLSVVVVVPALFLIAGVVACYLPARRASRVDPVVALRTL